MAAACCPGVEKLQSLRGMVDLLPTGLRGLLLTAMLAALASAGFLASYLDYHAHAGSKPFQGEGAIRLIYFAILLSHTVLAAVVVCTVAKTRWPVSAAVTAGDIITPVTLRPVDRYNNLAPGSRNVTISCPTGYFELPDYPGNIVNISNPTDIRVVG